MASFLVFLLRQEAGLFADNLPTMYSLVPGVLPEDLVGGARSASGNPYPISDQNM